MTRAPTKEFHRLQKNIASFTNNEARIVDFSDDLSDFQFDVEFKISDGVYRDAVFAVRIALGVNYPNASPEVTFITKILHPNIGDGFEDGAVCLNLLDDWLPSNDLEDIVHGLLFLIKNPNFSDPLNPIFLHGDSFYCAEENFGRLVRKALQGGEVEGTIFERNPGLGPQLCRDEMVGFEKTLESGGTCHELEEKQSNDEITSETTAQKEPCPLGSIPLLLDKTPHDSNNTPLVSMDCKISEIECNHHGISRVHESMARSGDRSWMVLFNRWLFRYARTIPRPFWNFKPRNNNESEIACKRLSHD